MIHEKHIKEVLRELLLEQLGDAKIVRLPSSIHIHIHGTISPIIVASGDAAADLVRGLTRAMTG